MKHPVTSHGVRIAPGGLDRDSVVRLSLVDSGTLPVRNNQEFEPVGTGLKLDLGNGAELVGQADFEIPYDTDRPEKYGVYWHLPEGLLIPLATTYDSGRATFVARLDFTNDALSRSSEVRQKLAAQSFTVSVVDESGFLSRPAHVDWPSYNLYVLENGTFRKVIDQGNAMGTIPAPGEEPLMIVHGLGSDIPRFVDAAVYLRAQHPFTAIYGFEYDTMSALRTSGPRLNLAYSRVENDPTSSWRHLAHSMGTLVSRVAFEDGSQPPYADNSVVFAAGPHLGSEAINVLQGSLGIFQRFVRYLVVNEVMNFRNADGTPCQVNVDDPGFTDLAQNSPALQSLNEGAAQNHPEEIYRTLGGNNPGLEYDAADFVMGVYPSDGLVDLSSANPGALIGAVKSDVVPESHSSIVEDTVNSLPIILNDLLAP